MHKEPISIDKIETKRIVLSYKELYGNKGVFKYFVGYLDKGGFLWI